MSNASPNTRLPFAISLELGSSLANHTGSWRTQRPVYVDRMPPCNASCPAGENIQAWLYLAEEGRYEEAWQKIVEDNPFPAIHGRVCYHPCEGACNRGQLDEPVSVHAVERYLGDEAIKRGWTPKLSPPTGKRITVIGAGPTGLSAAFHLTRLGHEVTVHDAGQKPGGMMRYGIPKYRLPREILDAEIERMRRMGIAFVPNARIKDLARFIERNRPDAIFLAVGAGSSKKVEIPSAVAGKVLDALNVLRDVEANPSAIRLGRRVAVYGGGNTAMDAARTARRLGAEDVVIIYRRGREQMPAHAFELTEAQEEGVTVKWLSTIASVGTEKITIERMTLDENARAVPTGQFEELDADTVLLAVGQDADTAFLRGVDGLNFADDGSLLVDEQMMAKPGVFAGGDMTPVTRTVTHGVGNGKRAARCIDAWLRGEKYAKPGADRSKEVATFHRLNTWYYTDAPRHIQQRLSVLRRAESFKEVTSGLTETDAKHESRRCLSCGNCFECDNCYGMCPDNAVIKLGPGNRFAFEYDYCKGCGLCAQECPCGAITMVDETI